MCSIPAAGGEAEAGADRERSGRSTSPRSPRPAPAPASGAAKASAASAPAIRKVPAGGQRPGHVAILLSLAAALSLRSFYGRARPRRGPTTFRRGSLGHAPMRTARGSCDEGPVTESESLDLDGAIGAGIGIPCGTVVAADRARDFAAGSSCRRCVEDVRSDCASRAEPPPPTKSLALPMRLCTLVAGDRCSSATSSFVRVGADRGCAFGLGLRCSSSRVRPESGSRRSCASRPSTPATSGSRFSRPPARPRSSSATSATGSRASCSIARSPGSKTPSPPRGLLVEPRPSRRPRSLACWRCRAARLLMREFALTDYGPTWLARRAGRAPADPPRARRRPVGGCARAALARVSRAAT